MQFDAAASLSGSFGDDGQDRVRLAAPGAAAAYSESPTVTFSPLRDEEFHRRLVVPVEPTRRELFNDWTPIAVNLV